MMIVGGYPVFIFWFFESVFFRRDIFIFLIFEISSKFYSSKKSSNCLFIESLLIVLCVGTKFKCLFKSLKVSLQNLLVLRLITCPARSDWNLIVSSRVFSNLLKLTWFVRWSLWRWSVQGFLLGLRETRGLEFSRVLDNFISFVSSWWLFFICFNSLISSLSCFSSCWCL